MGIVAIRREPGGDVEPGFAAGDQKQDAARDHRADHLRDDVRKSWFAGKRLATHNPTDTAGLW